MSVCVRKTLVTGKGLSLLSAVFASGGYKIIGRTAAHIPLPVPGVGLGARKALKESSINRWEGSNSEF